MRDSYTSTTMTVHAAIFTPDGHTALRTHATGPIQHPEETSRRAAEHFLQHGAAMLPHALPHIP